MKQNRLFIAFMIIMLVAVSLVACGTVDKEAQNTETNTTSETEASTEREFEGRSLVIATYGGALDEAMQEHVVKRFEEETGAEVILNPAYQFAQLITEEKNPSVDLAFLDDARVIEGGNLDILEELDPSKISNWDNLYPEAIDPNHKGLAWVFGSYGIVYNKEKVNPAPTSWDDLWNPDYKGKIAVNDLVSNGGVQAFVASAKLEGGDERDVEKAFDRYKDLAPNLLTVSASTAQLTDMLTRGDVWMAPWWDGRALNLEDSVEEIGFVRPEEGAYATIVMLSMPKNTKNKDMAYRFIDMALDPEAQVEFATDMYYGPTNKNTELSAELAERVVYGEEVSELQFVDWDYVSTVRGTWILRWNQEIVPLLQ